MEQKSGKGYRKAALIATLVVLLAVAAGCIGMLLVTGVNESRYSSAIKLANEYYTAGDYASAIQEYERAIAIDEKKEAAYLNMASAYAALGNYSSARSTIERGMELLDSQSLQERLEYYDLQIIAHSGDGYYGDTAETAVMTADQIEKSSTDISAENAIFDMIASYTYTDYYRDFGAATSTGTVDGKTQLYYAALDMDTYYYDLDGEKVLDGSSMPLATARACEVSLRDLTRVFAGSADSFAVSRAKLEELFPDAQFYQTSDGTWVMSVDYKNCNFIVATDESGNIVSSSASNTISPLYRSAEEESDEESEGEISGYVQDATTGRGMKATIKIRERDRKVGDTIAEVTSGVDGSYTYGGDAGRYTAEVSATGYITEYVDIEIVNGQIKAGENIVLTPEAAEGEIRIVLTWGSSPADLDSYARGTSSSGSSFNICYYNQSVANVGQLDVDDVNGYGPETITITDTGASFTFSVMDYRVTGYLPGCGATVKVYLPGESTAQTFTVPSGEGVLWNVFRYENGSIQTINTLQRLDEISTNYGSK